MAVIGADEPDFEGYVGEADDARPHGGDEEMHIRALEIHVEDAVVGAVVDDARARPPLAAPDPPVR
jgi:hypothetical protein